MNKLKSYSQEIGEKLFFFGTLLFAVLLPIHKMSTTIPLVVMLVGFILGKKSFDIKKDKFTGFILLLLFYFFIHIISFFNSEYLKFAKPDLIVKLPLLVLPLIFLLKPKITPKKISLIFSCFLLSAVILSIIINLYFAYQLIFNQVVLSNGSLLDFTIMHPSYLSMYLLFALAILLNKNYLIASINNKSFLIIAFIILSLSLILLGSRIALGFFFIFLIIKMYRHFGNLKALLFSFLFILFSSLLVWNVSFLKLRFSKAIKMFSSSKEKVNQYVVDDRIMIWSNALELIQEKPILGYSIGDYREVYLRERHNLNGFGKGYRSKLNAHNQFLESWLALGFLGFLSLVSLYILLIYIGIKTHESVFLSFVFILFSFSLVESIFQSQGGIMFSGFVIGLFLNKFKE